MAYLKDSEYQRRKTTTHIVIHCSATKPSQDVGVDQIREWHIKERGWKDVGYHYVIKRDGTRQMGRPNWATGAHVEGANWCSLGICLVGGVNEQGEPENNFTPEQMATLKESVSILHEEIYRKAEVCGHHDFPDVQKACPSFDAKGWWAPIGAALDKRMGRDRQ